MFRSHLPFAVLIGVVLALMLASCAPAADRSPAAALAVAAAQPAAGAVSPTATAIPTTAAPAAPGPAAAYPLTLNDDLGREVTMAARPSRIVSLAPSNTEILFAIGAGPQVIGLTEYCNYPPDAAQGRDIVGGYSADSLSLEKIVSLKPDLVLTGGAPHESIASALEAAGITVFNLDPKDLEDVYGDILATGALTGNAAQAEKVVADMKARIEKVSAAADSIPEDDRVKVFYEVWDEPLMSAGPATFVGQLIELAGGSNVFADVKEQYPMVSSEAVVARNPDIIVGPSTHVEGLTAAKIAARPGWGELAAAKAGRIVIVDGDIISRAGPRLADALEAVAQGIYPDRFK